MYFCIINITDIAAEFSYEDDGGVTTCWIPNHINIDFGIGSSIIVVGRTSQRIVDGEADPVTINLAGLYVTNRVGAPSEAVQRDEENHEAGSWAHAHVAWRFVSSSGGEPERSKTEEGPCPSESDSGGWAGKSSLTTVSW